MDQHKITKVAKRCNNVDQITAYKSYDTDRGKEGKRWPTAFVWRSILFYSWPTAVSCRASFVNNGGHSGRSDDENQPRTRRHTLTAFSRLLHKAPRRAMAELLSYKSRITETVQLTNYENNKMAERPI